MSAASNAASSGAVLGLVIVFLLQQFGRLALSDVLSSLLYLALGAIVGGLVFGLAAKAAGRKPKPAVSTPAQSTP